jgi:hypothetical protein
MQGSTIDRLGGTALRCRVQAHCRSSMSAVRASVPWRRSRRGAGCEASVGRSAVPTALRPWRLQAPGRVPGTEQSAGTVPCPGILHRDPGLAHNSLRAARCARTDAPSLLLKRAARAARLAALLGAPQAHRVPPRTDFAAALAVFVGKQPQYRPRVVRHPAGAICAATRSTAPGSARASALRDLTCRICPSAAPSPQGLERSELCGTTLGRAPQCSRAEGPTAAA